MDHKRMHLPSYKRPKFEHKHKDTYRQMKKHLKQQSSRDIAFDVKTYIQSLIAAPDVDSFEDLIEDKELLKGQEKLCKLTKNICKAMAKVYTKSPSITRSETVYNTNLLFPCFEEVLAILKKNEAKPYFVPGEDELEAMTIQLEKMGQKTDKRKIYKADGVVRLKKSNDIEIAILETAGAFGYDDRGKEAFDNSKGMFALLAMLKTIADRYKHATVEEFGKLKLYFVQPSGKCIRLWSMQYAKNGLYNYIREKKVLLSDDFEDRKEHLESLVTFFLTLMDSLEESMRSIEAIKINHEENQRTYDSEANSQELTLVDVICPKIFKISYSTHSQNFSREHLISSPESDC